LQTFVSFFKISQDILNAFLEKTLDQRDSIRWQIVMMMPPKAESPQTCDKLTKPNVSMP